MKRLVIAILGAVLLASTTAFAADMKVGVIDLPQVLQHSHQIEQINEKLQAQFKPQQEKIIAAQDKIRNEAKQLNPDQAKNLKAAEKQTIEKKLAADQKALQKMIVAFQTDVTEAQNKAMKSFMDQVDTTVKNIAEKQKLDMVLLKPAVVYANNTVDITQEVMDQLSK